MSISIKPFCEHESSPRNHLHLPVNADGTVYATDGTGVLVIKDSAAVAVDGYVEDALVVDGFPLQKLKTITNLKYKPPSVVKIPNLSKKKCSLCGGMGAFLDIRKLNEEGVGFVSLVDNHIWDNRNLTETCSECGGEGWIYESSNDDYLFSGSSVSGFSVNDFVFPYKNIMNISGLFGESALFSLSEKIEGLFKVESGKPEFDGVCVYLMGVKND